MLLCSLCQEWQLLNIVNGKYYEMDRKKNDWKYLNVDQKPSTSAEKQFFTVPNCLQFTGVTTTMKIPKVKFWKWIYTNWILIPILQRRQQLLL